MQTFVPVPRYKDGRAPKISSGYMTSDRPNHVGVDIMYPRLPQDGGPPGASLPPTYSRKHYMPPGVPALAWADGQVMESSVPSRGGYIVLEHPGGWRTQYMHLARRDVKIGDRVRGGQRIGIIGDDPTVNDPRHLHFQIRKNGVLANPAEYLNAAMIMPWPSTPVGTMVILAAGIVGGYYVYKRVAG